MVPCLLCAARQQDLADMTRINNELRGKLEKAMEQLIAAQTAKEHAREKVCVQLITAPWQAAGLTCFNLAHANAQRWGVHNGQRWSEH